MTSESRQNMATTGGLVAWAAGAAAALLVGCGGGALPRPEGGEPVAGRTAPVGTVAANQLPAARSVAGIALPAVAPPSATVSATLAWDPSPSATRADFGGYRLYWIGTNAATALAGSVDVGKVTTATISNLTRGVRYTFQATAYSTNGDESIYSNPATFPIPRTNYVTFGFKTNGVVAFQWTYTNPPGDVVLFTPFVLQTNNDVSVVWLQASNTVQVNNP